MNTNEQQKTAPQPVDVLAVGECVGFRWHGIVDRDGNDPWIYSVGRYPDPRAAADDFAAKFPRLSVELVYVATPNAAACLPSDAAVVRVSGGSDGTDATACWRVVLHGKEYTRHGDAYTRWFEARHPRTGNTYRKARDEKSPQKRALIDAAIARFGGAA